MEGASLDGTPYRVAPLEHDGVLPLAIGAHRDRDVGRLCAWLRERADWVEARLVDHGALLLRGFDVGGPEDFERIARAIDAELKNEYLGTSPRDSLSRSGYVFSASEIAGFLPIPQHCEMSFIAVPPRRVFFCALRPPTGSGGETPLCDFRKVYRDLDPGVRKRFEEGGLRIVRNYDGPSGGSRFDLWKLKRWDEMFLTRERDVVEEKCREQGFDVEWTGADGLRLIHTQPVVRHHATTGEPVWHNHVTTFHLSMAPGEYRRICGLRPEPRHLALWQVSRLAVAAQRRLRSRDEQAMHCTYADGSEIPDADVDAVRDAVWKNLVIEPWQRGDVLAIDNHSTSHGRLPYRGPREVAVCWA